MKAPVLLGVLLLGSLAEAAAGAPGPGGPAAGTDTYSKSAYSMGTLVEITVRLTEDTRKAEASLAVSEALEAVTALDSLLSTYKPHSQISVLNRISGGRALEVDPRVMAVLDSSLHYWKLTGGAFDITVGPLLDLYGFKGGAPSLPESGDLSRALALVDASGIELDRDAGSARLRRAGQKLDLGGIGKGFALDLAAEALKRRGISHAMLNFSGNLLFMGEAWPGTPWTAGVAHPRVQGTVIASFEARDVAVSTSGDYENYFTYDGRRYSHILDPRTGLPAGDLSSVTVIAPSASGADALSTAIAVMGPVAGMELIESLRGVEAILVPAPNRESPGSAGGESVYLLISSGLSGALEAAEGVRMLTSSPRGR